MQVLQNLVLSLWSNHTSSIQKQQAAAAADAPTPSYSTAFYLTLYFALGLGSVGVVLLRSALLVIGSIAASKRLHKQLLRKLLRLPMSFFDAQPSGEFAARERGGGCLDGLHVMIALANSQPSSYVSRRDRHTQMQSSLII
jgi:ATP-binding cassette subfamily C (CFTR/MRP) protein 1